MRLTDISLTSSCTSFDPAISGVLASLIILIRSVPAIYEKYNQNGQRRAYDEWTLSEQMRLDTAGGGIEKLMEDHYKTFIVRLYSTLCFQW